MSNPHNKLPNQTQQRSFDNDEISGLDQKAIIHPKNNLSYNLCYPHQTIYESDTHKFVLKNGNIGCETKESVIERKNIIGGALPLSKSPKKY